MGGGCVALILCVIMCIGLVRQPNEPQCGSLSVSLLRVESWIAGCSPKHEDQ